MGVSNPYLTVSVYLSYCHLMVVSDPYLTVSLYPPLPNMPLYASYPQVGLVGIVPPHLANGLRGDLGVSDPCLAG